MSHDRQPSLRPWYWAFALLGLWALFFFVLSLWRDYAREWKGYQKTFFRMELAAAKEEREREMIRGRDYELDQVMVADGRRTDRCTTCHLGIEDPRFRDAPQPFRTHPPMPQHPFEKFGCTVCHQGQDMATTVKAAHGDVKFWEEPMLRGPYIQAACGACHAATDLTEAPLLTRGRRLFQEKGCGACHKIRGTGGSLGPDLTLVGNRRKDPEWHLRHLRAPQATSPGSAMPPFAGLAEEELQALTVFMLSLREAPPALVASTPLPASPPAEAKVAQIARTAPAARDGSAALARGRALYAQRGCAACHVIRGVGGQVGPDLTVEGSKPGRDLEWHLKHFRNPLAISPGSIMPPLADVKEEDLKALAEYMLSLK